MPQEPFPSLAAEEELPLITRPEENTEQRITRLLALPLSAFGPEQYYEIVELADLVSARAHFLAKRALELQSRVDKLTAHAIYIGAQANALRLLVEHLASSGTDRSQRTKNQ